MQPEVPAGNYAEVLVELPEALPLSGNRGGHLPGGFRCGLPLLGQLLLIGKLLPQLLNFRPEVVRRRFRFRQPLSDGSHSARGRDLSFFRVSVSGSDPVRSVGGPAVPLPGGGPDPGDQTSQPGVLRLQRTNPSRAFVVLGSR